MKLELLAECVTRLAECDIDNPADQKTISVCENYILESYDYYLESCEMNGYEPLSKSEYLQEMMLNEGFFKKLLGFGALAGGAVAAGVGIKKGYNAINQNAARNNMQNASFKDKFNQFRKDSGGVGGMAKNVWNTSRKTKQAERQYQNGNLNVNYTQGEQGGQFNKTISVNKVKGNRRALKNGTAGSATITSANGTTRTGNAEQIGNQAAKLNNRMTAQQQKKQQEQAAGSTPKENNPQNTQTPEETPKPSATGGDQKSKKPLRDANGNEIVMNEIFVASELKQPLTPAIKTPSKYQ